MCAYELCAFECVRFQHAIGCAMICNDPVQIALCQVLSADKRLGSRLRTSMLKPQAPHARGTSCQRDTSMLIPEALIPEIRRVRMFQ